MAIFSDLFQQFDDDGTCTKCEIIFNLYVCAKIYFFFMDVDILLFRCVDLASINAQQERSRWIDLAVDRGR